VIGLKLVNQYYKFMIKKELEEEVRQKILKNPELILLDKEIFMSLINEKNFSEDENIIDIRNAFLKRLGAKLEKLKDANSKIIKRAYQNQLSVTKIHKCCLKILNSKKPRELLDYIFDELPTLLKIDSIKVILEKKAIPGDDILQVSYKSEEVINKFSEYVGITKSRIVVLRENVEYEERRNLGLSSLEDKILSEAIMGINIEGHLVGLVFFESKNKMTFSTDQATDHLEFLSKIISRKIEDLNKM
jgi:uncharacterized protein YigA (DUF484 family)